MQIEFGMANQYIRDLSQNVVRGMAKRARGGKWNHLAPLGYFNKSHIQNEKIVDKTVEIDEDRVTYIKEIFDLRLANYSFEDIAKEISARGLRTRSGRRIQKSVIKHMLNNPFYIGMIKFGEEYLEGQHKPIIEPWKFKRIQGMRTHNYAKVDPKKFPLKGLLACAYCKKSLTADLKKKKYVYYRCQARDCKGGNMSQGKVEELIGECVSQYDLNKEEKEMMIRGLQDAAILAVTEGQDSVRRYERRIKETEDMKDSLLEMRLKKAIDLKDFSKKYKRICVDLEVMRKQYNRAKSKIENAQGAHEMFELLENLSGSYFAGNSRYKAMVAKMFSSNYLISEKKAGASQEEPLFKLIRQIKTNKWCPIFKEVRTIIQENKDGFNALPVTQKLSLDQVQV